jgi:hypothetical protein
MEAINARNERLEEEMIAAARVSPLEREKVRERILNGDFRELPLQYEEFKLKYLGMVQHARSFGAQI